MVGMRSIPLAFSTLGNPALDKLGMLVVWGCTARSTAKRLVQIIRGFTVQVYSSEPFCTVRGAFTIPPLSPVPSPPSPRFSGVVGLLCSRLYRPLILCFAEI